MVGGLIGRGGTNISAIARATGARVHVSTPAAGAAGAAPGGGGGGGSGRCAAGAEVEVQISHGTVRALGHAYELLVGRLHEVEMAQRADVKRKTGSSARE